MNFEVHVCVMSFLARQAVKLWEPVDGVSPRSPSSCLRCFQAELLAACCWTDPAAAVWTGAAAVMEKKRVSLISEQ